MVGKAVRRSHAGNENGRYGKENKFIGKKNEGGSLFYFSNKTFSSHSSPRRNNCSSEFYTMPEMISWKYREKSQHL